MFSVAARIVTVVLLGAVTAGVSGACPWHCICNLYSAPITTNCSGLSLDNFPPDIDLRIQWLDLKENSIQNIPNMDKYSELEILELSWNRISRISNSVFRKLTVLKHLDLSHNLFTDWSQVNVRILLQSLSKLITLNLSYNSLKSFSGRDGRTTFTSSSLENLHLRSCRISQVNGKALAGFRRLKYLDLSSNPIKWLDDLSSPTLTHLDVSYCDIDSMNPNALRNLPSLTTLKLSGNSQFAVNHGNLTSGSLQALEVAHCSLTAPGLFGFPNLTYANLRGNKMVAIQERSFIKNKLLVELDLSANEIRELHPQGFIAARQLAFVNLSANALKGSLPWNTFSTNYNLKTLDLSVNRLESVGNLSILGLENLDISQCLIKEMRKDSLTGLPWLMHLNMSHNPLESIPDDIQSWYLRDIDLSYCRLSSITNDTFKRFPEIVTINLTGNRFTNPFKIYMFDYNDRLDSLKLGDNPWICDCNSQDFKAFWEFLTHFPIKITPSQQKSLKCMAPDSVAGRSWMVACYYTWYPVAEPESAFGLTHYGTALLVMVITVAGIFAVIGAIKHGIKKRMKEEDEQMERERDMGRTYETEPRIVFQRRENYDFEAADSPELRLHRTDQRGRTDSQLTQPPTYEEAVQMLSASREVLSASREDIASREGVVTESAVDSEPEESSGNSDSEAEGEYSVGSDDSDNEQAATKALNGATNK